MSTTSNPLNTAIAQEQQPITVNVPGLGPVTAQGQDAQNILYDIQNGIEIPLANPRPNPTTDTTTLPTNTGNWLTDEWNKYLNASSQMQNADISNPNTAIAGISGTTPEALATGQSNGAVSLAANVVAILAGLVLIAGAVFSFSQVKDTIVTTAKGAAAFAA